MPQERKRIVVLGGYGAVGQRICAAISRLPYVECVVAGRNPRSARRVARQILATPLQLDAEDEQAVAQQLVGSWIVVDAAGSFQQRSPTVAQFCARNGIHYLDLSDDRSYSAKILKLDSQAKRGGGAIVTGAGTLPGLASVLVDSLRNQFSKLEEIHVHASFGGQVPYGAGSAGSLLTSVGTPIRVKVRGRWRQEYYWTRPQSIAFPAPVGRRRTYLVDVPAADSFVQHYDAQTIEFHSGTQAGILNRVLSLYGWLRRRGTLTSARSGRIAHRLARALATGTSRSSGIVVFIKGVEQGDLVTHSVALVEDAGDELGIVTSLIQTLVQRWTESETAEPGAVSAVGLLDLESLKPVLIEHHVRLVRA
jgi:saccharopine dehydrogenase-like NADP-dependent oxidoreductase